MMKPAEKLTVSDLIKYPVWQFLNHDEIGETAVEPVKETPVRDTSNRLFGVQVTLTNGQRVWAVIGNVDNRDAQRTRQFLAISIERKAKWFHLARYFDDADDTRGPLALAKFLELPLRDIFPITYDLSDYAVGKKNALIGKIESKPKEKLDSKQLMKLLVSNLQPPRKATPKVRLSKTQGTRVSPGAEPSEFVQPDDVLAAIIGSRKVARNKLTQKVLAYIEERKLLKRGVITADEKLRALFDGEDSLMVWRLADFFYDHTKPVE